MRQGEILIEPKLGGEIWPTTPVGIPAAQPVVPMPPLVYEHSQSSANTYTPIHQEIAPAAEPHESLRQRVLGLGRRVVARVVQEAHQWMPQSSVRPQPKEQFNYWEAATQGDDGQPQHMTYAHAHDSYGAARRRLRGAGHL